MSIRMALGRAAAGLVLALLVLLIGALPALAAQPDGPDSLGLDATYDVSANIHWAAAQMSVSSTAHITNNTAATVDALTFNAAPAVIGSMNLTAVQAGPDPASAVVEDENIIVSLPAPLDPAASIDVTISYDATLGGATGDKQFLFAKVNGIATAYRWIPWLSRPYTFATPTFGEPFVTQASTDVKVTITTDRRMPIATSGQMVSSSGNTSSYVARDVRDFNFAMSPRYRVRTTQWNGVAVSYFYIDLPVDKVQTYATAALNRFSRKLGAYPYPTLNIAEVPTGPSMESPAMVWIARHATSRGSLRYLTVHELAHQWFYGVVGNDQAAEPFADEALAEFMTRDLLGHRASKCADQELDKSVYHYGAACYYEVIYVQGDRYLNAYRQKVGNAAFWSGMRSYFEQYRFKIGGIRQLFDVLDSAANGAGYDHTARFPGIYPGDG